MARLSEDFLEGIRLLQKRQDEIREQMENVRVKVDNEIIDNLIDVLQIRICEAIDMSYEAIPIVLEDALYKWYAERMNSVELIGVVEEVKEEIEKYGMESVEWTDTGLQCYEQKDTKNKAFTLGTDCKEQINTLTDSEAGKVFKAILNYASGNKPEELDGETLTVYRSIETQIKSTTEEGQE